MTDFEKQIPMRNSKHLATWLVCIALMSVMTPSAVVAQETQKIDSIVALVDDEEATLKRFRRKGASIALEAANPAYETRIFGPDRVKVQGKLVGLIRRYN